MKTKEEEEEERNHLEKKKKIWPLLKQRPNLTFTI
uniref:Uncharacterized protein n=1 Tax=Tetranychus urticae TaxID=32264 RepID=T1K0C5_TETUR